MHTVSNSSGANQVAHSLTEEAVDQNSLVSNPARKMPKKTIVHENITVDVAKKVAGEQLSFLRDFSNQLAEYLKNTSQVVGSGDFGPSTVEGADRLLKAIPSAQESLGKIYDVVLERNYARLPPRRKR